MKQIKCPHCGNEFNLNPDKEINKSKPVTLRFMGISKSIGRPKFIDARCPGCRRSFKVRT